MDKDKKPLIGITIDYQTSASYSEYPWYALRANYAQAISDNGGVPILLPYTTLGIDVYSQLIDGLLISGGNFDIDPAYYQEQVQSDRVEINDDRTAFEIALIKSTLALNKPILGICGGHQLINVIFGGNLIQHIPDTIPNALEHEQKNAKHLPSHKIDIMPKTLLSKIVGCSSYMVNSTHHQAINKLGHNIIVNAVAPDGVIEGIESTKHLFCLGVEWHPEYCQSQEDRNIFTAFLNACRNG